MISTSGGGTSVHGVSGSFSSEVRPGSGDPLFFSLAGAPGRPSVQRLLFAAR